MMIGSDIAEPNSTGPSSGVSLSQKQMSAVLVKLLAGITPPPIVIPKEYDGWQLQWKSLVFRPACTF
jgi:hypothetical protein